MPAVNKSRCTEAQAVCSPHLTLTLIGENCLMGSAKAKQDECKCRGIQKFFTQSTFLITCTHEQLSCQDMQAGGTLVNEKCCTDPLVASDLDPSHPKATVDDSMSLAWAANTSLASHTQPTVHKVTQQHVHAHDFKRKQTVFNQPLASQPPSFQPDHFADQSLVHLQTN